MKKEVLQTIHAALYAELRLGDAHWLPAGSKRADGRSV
ncbi:hypothetical protein SAMN05216387_11445 [Nitrosovibrio tenuis]|uniref:Uncharacterized protein n=1 Tax=Nitrosovibrio tenuis TaxID=1233 RepID=A0A1H7R1I9_9PROT|nr:hypothetical protein SAMN05216387_11445 [Nitrosovibrio tenuis]